MSDKSAAGRRLMRSRQNRRIFFVELFRLFRVVWPMLSGVLFAMVGPGLLIGHIEKWRIEDALYFTFVTGLTIGYGDLTPRHCCVAAPRSDDWLCRYRADRPRRGG